MRLIQAGLLAMIVATPTPALAWGALGHSAVALIAEQRLTTQTLANARAILLGAPLVTGMNFADEYRVHHPETTRWHFVDIPDEEDDYVPTRDCVVNLEGDCIIAAIEREKEIIIDPDAGVFERADALKRLVHWVGDIHQPFHATERTVNGIPDRGGNELSVKFFDAPTGTRATNMHALWDSGMFTREGVFVEDLVEEIVDDIIPTLSNSEIAEDEPIAWALESHATAHDAYLPDVPNQAEIITQAYLDEQLPVAKRQLALAGVRLANVLNELLGGQLPPDF